MLVKNMHSGSNGGGWLTKWKNYKCITGDVMCSCCRERKAVHGGHVIKASSNATKEWYIVPLCADCNEGKEGTGEFFVYDNEAVRVTELERSSKIMEKY